MSVIDRVITYTDYDGGEKTEHFYFNTTKAEMDEAHKVNPTTNCVNCGAVIDPNIDHCEYCGTSYALMGISCASRLQVENELLRAKTKALVNAEEIKALYKDALNAMRSYRSRY